MNVKRYSVSEYKKLKTKPKEKTNATKKKGNGDTDGGK